MSRNRFLNIKSNIYVAYNLALDPVTRMTKVKPLYDILNQKLPKMFEVVHENISVDELMVPFFGRNSCKQFMKVKAIRIRFKIWMLASSNGMPYHTHIYEGKAVDKDKDTLGNSRIRIREFKQQEKCEMTELQIAH